MVDAHEQQRGDERVRGFKVGLTEFGSVPGLHSYMVGRLNGTLEQYVIEQCNHGIAEALAKQTRSFMVAGWARFKDGHDEEHVLEVEVVW